MPITYTLSRIHEAAKRLWKLGKQYKIWAFYGEMGAGKTTLIHAICEELQVTDVVSSPTFSIINEYRSDIAGVIYHMDWYRIKDEEEAMQAGIEDCLLSDNFCLIEWPEKAQGILPSNILNIYMQPINSNTRKLQLK